MPTCMHPCYTWLYIFLIGLPGSFDWCSTPVAVCPMIPQCTAMCFKHTEDNHVSQASAKGAEIQHMKALRSFVEESSSGAASPPSAPSQADTAETRPPCKPTPSPPKPSSTSPSNKVPSASNHGSGPATYADTTRNLDSSAHQQAKNPSTGTPAHASQPSPSPRPTACPPFKPAHQPSPEEPPPVYCSLQPSAAGQARQGMQNGGSAAPITLGHAQSEKAVNQTGAARQSQAHASSWVSFGDDEDAVAPSSGMLPHITCVACLPVTGNSKYFVFALKTRQRWYVQMNKFSCVQSNLHVLMFLVTTCMHTYSLCQVLAKSFLLVSQKPFPCMLPA